MALKEIHHGDPYIVGKNLGTYAANESANLPQANAEGWAVIDLTQEQKYTFDRNGWLLTPAVLNSRELKEMQEFAQQLAHQPESIAAHQRFFHGRSTAEIGRLFISSLNTVP